MRVWSFFIIILCWAVCSGGFSLRAQGQEADDPSLHPIKRILKSRKSSAKLKKPLVYDSALPPVQTIFKKVEKIDFHVGRISGHTTEGGKRAQFSVKLLAKPIRDVNIKIVSKNENEGKAKPEILTFTLDNWGKERTVTVTGQDDAVVDGDREYIIEVLVEKSNDLRYERLPSQKVVVVNKDDDKLGFNVKQINKNTTEGGGEAAFSVSLKSEPVAPVTLAFSSDNRREGRLEKTEFVFTPDNWNQKQVIKVIGQDDIAADGRRSYKVRLRQISGKDPKYAALTLPAINFYNEDNDLVGLVISKVLGRASETGEVASFSARLKSMPLSKVILDVASSNPKEGVVKPSRLIFTSKNWKKRRILEVIGVDDKIMDGPQTFYIGFSGISSPDKAYRSLKPVKVAVINDDDDKVGFRFGKVSGNTSEDGKKVTLKVSLTSKPTAKVKLLLKSGNQKEGKLITKALEFDSQNWDKEHVITAQGADDIEADGPKTFQIVTLPAQSKDPNYNNLDPADIDVINEDNDKPQIIIGSIDGRTSENGDEASFSVSLATRPLAEVTIEFVVSDKTEGKVKASVLTFNAENWNKKQKVTVVGLDDNEIDGNQSYSIISYPAQSNDLAYNNLDSPDVVVVNVDNNLKNFLVEKTGGDAEGNTDEGGISAGLKVRLPSPPKSAVYIDVSSSAPAEAKPEPSRLVFTPQNWDQDQFVKIKGMDDDRHDGPQPYQIVLKAESPGQPAYNNLPIRKFDFLNMDNDKAAIEVRLINTHSSENGDMAEFGLRLSSEPTSSVVFLLYSTNKAEGKLLMEHAAFKKENWNKEKIIRVKGVPDDVVDRHVEYYIICGDGAISGDKDYNKMKFDKVLLTNKNVDEARFVISQPSGPTTEEGGKAHFTVRLNSKPRAGVVFDLWSSNTREGVIDRKRLEFTPKNWDRNQAITVAGIDEKSKDEEQAYRVVFSAADSKDKDYHGLTPPNVNLINIDNKRVTAGAMAFYFKPQGDLATIYESTPGYGLSGGYVFDGRYSLGVALGSVSLKGSKIKERYHAIHSSDYKLDLISIMTGLKYTFLKRPFNIFVQPGIGIHSWKSSVSTSTDNLTRTQGGVEFGFFSGAGVEFSMIGNSFMSVEYNYHFVTLGDGRFMTLSVSANYPF